jgi:tellurite resistance protein TerC
VSAFLQPDFLGQAAWLWLTSLAVVVALLALDLGVLHKDDRETGAAESLRLSGGCIAVAALFGGWLCAPGPTAAAAASLHWHDG